MHPIVCVGRRRTSAPTTFISVSVVPLLLTTLCLSEVHAAPDESPVPKDPPASSEDRVPDESEPVADGSDDRGAVDGSGSATSEQSEDAVVPPKLLTEAPPSVPMGVELEAPSFVDLELTVSVSGEVVNPRVLHAPLPELGSEALQVVSSPRVAATKHSPS